MASDGQPADCDLLEQGSFYKNLSYRADTQGEAIVAAAIGLIQGKDKAGSKRLAFYTTPLLGDEQGRPPVLLRCAQGCGQVTRQ